MLPGQVAPDAVKTFDLSQQAREVLLLPPVAPSRRAELFQPPTGLTDQISMCFAQLVCSDHVGSEVPT